jgi:FKBP-type peptidyl-prolyl cis-trans isomerase FkpA
MLKLLTYLISTYLFIISCDTNPYPEYSRTWTGIYYKLHSIGETNIKPVAGDYVTVDLLYKTMNDSVFFAARRTFQLTEPEFRGSIDECFLLLSSGDCGTFIINSEHFFTKTLKSKIPTYLLLEEKMKVVIYMLDIISENEFQKQKKEFLSWIEDFGEYESTILKEYIKKLNINIEENKSVYQLKINNGNGISVKRGDNITVHYEGRFLNGEYFDSTRKRNQAFEFTYGQEWQVIKGMEIAIGKMTEGEKSVFIMPSTMAFGSDGSSTGIIPPFTSVIFEVELIKIETEKDSLKLTKAILF